MHSYSDAHIHIMCYTRTLPALQNSLCVCMYQYAQVINMALARYFEVRTGNFLATRKVFIKLPVSCTVVVDYEGIN